MSPIRPMTRADLTCLVGLYRRAFAETPNVPDGTLHAYFDRILFGNPWRSDDLPSFVYEEGGEMVGAIGVVAGRLLFDGKPVRVAVSNHFVVDPLRRSSMAGVHLLKAFFEGKQDLGIAEGNDASRKLWERLGGALSPAYSMHWVTPLRPARYAITSTGRGALLRALAAPFDALLTRLPGPFRRRRPALRREEMTVPLYLDAVARLTKGYRVRPDPDEASAAWLFDLLARKTRFGRLRKDLLRDGDHIVGWCIWYEKPGGTGQVVDVGATAESIDAVLGWLFHEALAGGTVALVGRVTPDGFGAHATHVMLLSPAHTWMLVQARDPELLAAIQSGRAHLSRLEGEWWIPYHEA